jgi:hypothetical protein
MSIDVVGRNDSGCGGAPLGCGVAQSRVQRRSVRVRLSSMVRTSGYCKAGFESWPGNPWRSFFSKLNSSDEEIFRVDSQGEGGANDFVLCKCKEEK